MTVMDFISLKWSESNQLLLKLKDIFLLVMSSMISDANKFILVIFLTIVVLLVPTPMGLSDSGKRAIAAFVFAGSIFSLQPLSLPFSSLMVSIVLVYLGVSETSQAFFALSSPIIILILGSLFMAEALRKKGLTRRLAFHAIIQSGGNIDLLLLSLMFIAAFLSMWMENTATAAVLIPVALTISNQVPDKDAAQEVSLLLILGIAYSASLGGMVTITGSASNAVASAFLTTIMNWSFLDWVRYGLVSFIVVFPFTWWILSRVLNIRTKSLNIDVARGEINNMGNLSKSEWEVLMVISITAILWVTGSSIESSLGLESHILSPSIVAITAVIFLALRGVIIWEDVKGVSWGMFFVIGAGLSLGSSLQRTGATEWLAGFLSPLISSNNFFLVILFLVFLSSALTNIVNNATVAAVFVPILINIANRNPNLNAVQLVLPLTLATTFGYALPSASGRMALIHSTGLVKRRDMIKYGLILTFASSFILSILFYLMSVVGWI